jgi:hypothetical protein
MQRNLTIIIEKSSILALFAFLKERRKNGKRGRKEEKDEGRNVLPLIKILKKNLIGGEPRLRINEIAPTRLKRVTPRQ